MNIYTITILISILTYVALGNYAGRKVKDVEDYFVVGRQAPTLLIVGTLVASFLSTNTFLGDAGFTYSFNASRILIPGLFLVQLDLYILQETIFQAQGHEEDILFILDGWRRNK